MGTSALIPANMERFMELSSMQEQVVSTNIANVDTPGYHAKEAKFSSFLMTADHGQDAEMVPVSITDEGGLTERADGNNVDADKEGLALAKAQLQYMLGVQLIKGRFHQELSAINGGGNS